MIFVIAASNVCSGLSPEFLLSGSSSIFSFLSKSVMQDLDSDNGQWTTDSDSAESESSPNPLDSAESESESTDSVVH